MAGAYANDAEERVVRSFGKNELGAEVESSQGGSRKTPTIWVEPRRPMQRLPLSFGSINGYHCNIRH